MRKKAAKSLLKKLIDDIKGTLLSSTIEKAKEEQRMAMDVQKVIDKKLLEDSIKRPKPKPKTKAQLIVEKKYKDPERKKRIVPEDKPEITEILREFIDAPDYEKTAMARKAILELRNIDDMLEEELKDLKSQAPVLLAIPPYEQYRSDLRKAVRNEPQVTIYRTVPKGIKRAVQRARQLQAKKMKDDKK